MKRKIEFGGVLFAMVLLLNTAFAQKFDEERMKRDIEVTENVLTTVVKQQFANQRTFFPLDVKGSYQAGYGVTFTIPADFTTPIVFAMPNEGNNVMVWSDEPGESFDFEFNTEEEREHAVKEARAVSSGHRLKERSVKRKTHNLDSVREVYNQKIIGAVKTFMVDYGDMITQLAPNEKIIVSNQGNQPKRWVNQYFGSPKRSHLSIEVAKADLSQYKQGKLNRDQALAKVKVINTEAVDTVEPDLELLSSIFNRLYRYDLSKTYFIEDNINFERLKDFGIIYYMNAISSYEVEYKKYAMPTLKLEGIDEETRKKKATELYPKFEQELRDNILEYGRTLKSLKDDEVLVFQVRITRCVDCGIPATLELSIKGNVLKDYSAGSLSKDAANKKFEVKKGAKQ